MSGILLNGHEYYEPCKVCGKTSAHGCDHRTKEDFERIKKNLNNSPIHQWFLLTHKINK
ncbi:hypothetical protein M0R04_08335 [Candidatus Dojkabacteria bacterium]|jgi:hypothetical protein|nr:hypothetical protein [Candidatus Dojkabacteria bacterium]